MSNEELIQQTALQQGIPPELALAVAQKESGIDQTARGSSGEIGIFQLMPGTASDLGVNPYSTQGNIQGGIQYLKQLYQRFGDWATALMAYNAGPTAVSQGRIPASSRSYASSILNVYNPDSGLGIEAGSGLPEEAALLSPGMTLLIIAGIIGVAMLVTSRD